MSPKEISFEVTANHLNSDCAYLVYGIIESTLFVKNVTKMFVSAHVITANYFI